MWSHSPQAQRIQVGSLCYSLSTIDVTHGDLMSMKKARKLETARKLRRTLGAVYSKVKLMKCSDRTPSWTGQIATKENLNSLFYIWSK